MAYPLALAVALLWRAIDALSPVPLVLGLAIVGACLVSR